uniref:Uncharacterized protein n=1 Tax=Pipistrellus kuhlii TaxID=59472 RepID=A0A7J8B161_PIPKU|nr:hypothetical protein mPipKuh1_007663 [Pipistrellus kuhlii]
MSNKTAIEDKVPVKIKYMWLCAAQSSGLAFRGQVMERYTSLFCCCSSSTEDIFPLIFTRTLSLQVDALSTEQNWPGQDACLYLSTLEPIEGAKQCSTWWDLKPALRVYLPSCPSVCGVYTH